MKGNIKKSAGKMNASSTSMYIQKMQAMGAPGFRKNPGAAAGSSSNVMCREEFLKTVGVGAAAVGAATMGFGAGTAMMSGTANATSVPVDGPSGGGSLVGAVKLDPKLSYVGVPELLHQYISLGSEDAWTEIKGRIDYTYDCLHHALKPLLLKSDPALKNKLLSEVYLGKKILFKPNAIHPMVLDTAGDGTPGSGITVATDWVMLAALMRWMHDKLDISYYKMAMGEAGSFVTPYAMLIGCAPEALLEGAPFTPDAHYFAGYPFYFVRKYLAESHDPTHTDDPMSGYMDSVMGNYIPPGQATNKLMVYDLNNAEAHVAGGRGRLVQVPDGGANFKDGIVIHKAVVGDPDDSGNYPGCVLISVPKMKVHVLTSHTIALKNLGIGGYPMISGADSDPSTPDWLYSYPPAFPPGIKQGLPHSRHYFDLDPETALPTTPKETDGMDGTIVDIHLAINSQVPVRIHVVDGITAINIDPASGGGAAVEEGYVFASEDPVALDVLCCRYMFKNVPRALSRQYGLEFAMGALVPYYDSASNTIKTQDGLDSPLSRITTFASARARNFGKTNYYVDGMDKSGNANSSLVSDAGHLGKIIMNKFSELLPNGFYFGGFGLLWHLQTTALAYAYATDTATQTIDHYTPNFYGEFMELDENSDGAIDFSEYGTTGAAPVIIGLMGRQYNLLGKGDPWHGTFIFFDYMLKYSDPLWNPFGKFSLKANMDAYSTMIAMQMIYGPEAYDPFIPGLIYGIGEDGTSKWPSLQYARFILDMTMIYTYVYNFVLAYAAGAGTGFTFYVPLQSSYCPVPGLYKALAQLFNPDVNLDLIEETSDPAKILTVKFGNGEVW